MEELKGGNTGASVIRQILAYRGLSIAEVARGLGYNSTQVLSNKLYRNSLNLDDFIRIIDFLDCHVNVVTNDLKNSYRMDSKEDLNNGNGWKI